METTETRDHEPHTISKESSSRLWRVQRFLNLGPLGLALIQGFCAATLFLSGIRTALGFSSLIAAAAAGPATGFHADRIRIPMLAVAGIGAVVNSCSSGTPNVCARTRLPGGECVRLPESSA